MSDATTRLTLQLLEWVAARPRTRGEAMEAWRSTCPRISIWEDALIDDLIELDCAGRPMAEARITLTPRGREILEGSTTLNQSARD